MHHHAVASMDTWQIPLGLYKENGKENGNHDIIGFYRGYIGRMEKKMETTSWPNTFPIRKHLIIPHAQSLNYAYKENSVYRRLP